MIQDHYHCKCITYWVEEPRGAVFCLIEAPNKPAVEEMHKNSHGLMPSKIIEVSNEVVESFLGRIHDPQEAEITGDGLKIIRDSAYRILLIADFLDPVLIQQSLGTNNANDLMVRQGKIIRDQLIIHGGREVDFPGYGFTVSFTSAVQALSCALDIQTNLPDTEKEISGLKIGMNAGPPISRSDQLFGDTIQFAKHLCTIIKNHQIAVSSAVKELLSPGALIKGQKTLVTVSPQNENLIESLFQKLEENWTRTDFSISEFGSSMSMSKSQLYRKTMDLWRVSPNMLLKDFRLQKARELLKSRKFNISQAAFDSGFNSPSYFTKCFKRKFGVLPLQYISSQP